MFNFFYNRILQKNFIKGIYLNILYSFIYMTLFIYFILFLKINIGINFLDIFSIYYTICVLMMLEPYYSTLRDLFIFTFFDKNNPFFLKLYKEYSLLLIKKYNTEDNKQQSLLIKELFKRKIL